MKGWQNTRPPLSDGAITGTWNNPLVVPVPSLNDDFLAHFHSREKPPATSMDVPMITAPKDSCMEHVLRYSLSIRLPVLFSWGISWRLWRCHHEKHEPSWYPHCNAFCRTESKPDSISDDGQILSLVYKNQSSEIEARGKTRGISISVVVYARTELFTMRLMLPPNKRPAIRSSMQTRKNWSSYQTGKQTNQLEHNECGRWVEAVEGPVLKPFGLSIRLYMLDIGI